MRIQRLDHLVLTVADLDRTVDFYTRGLGMQAETFDGDRRALRFGGQKINLHQAGHEAEPKAASPTPGSGDLCLVTDLPLTQVQEHLRGAGIAVELGPVRRTGAMGPMTSLYVRDPDDNLIEIASYRQAPATG
ncbi:glyoxalase [Micromonospora rosaria]|uniref:Glyoxalase n=1 Tax=Micromonospora rosaria TaxID=47874 RepID=A0A136PLE3_9ACTN|nr:VOC family protein [Micromonospora rosaria]KXK59239.1 glyoxalase [Micromonospora rosaria]